MRIDRIGFTPLKGGRHLAHPSVELSADGPVGDRLFCLVDPARRRVVRTVENPSLLSTSASWADDVLSVEIEGHTLCEQPRATGAQVEADYWGRPAALDLLDGPWGEAYSRLLGYSVVLARSTSPGDVVYADPISIITTSSMGLLSQKLGREVESERFRATFLIDSEDLEPHAEDAWDGRHMRLGTARIRVLGGIPRCAVVDVGPATGTPDARVLKTLAGYRRGGDEISFGVYAVVTQPGTVSTGDRAELERS